ncbi:MAG TPA: hypothetical protein DHV85_12620, partial [Candidatus Accumulibacter sp.]|nr:hypothetical protein [Accumulibacter sp.]
MTTTLTKTMNSKESLQRLESLRLQVLEMLAVVTAFTQLLKRETEALRKADFNAVDLLQADKRLYAKQYEAKITALVQRQNDFPLLDLTLRERLMQERTVFGVAL